jgi:protein-disulfide isomerase
MNKQFFAIIVVVIAGLVGVFALTGGNKDKNGGSSSNSTATATNHVTGAKDAKVTLVEYGDFQCPACKSYFPLVQELKTTYGDRVTFQFRHFPLVQIHPNAFVGARAAEAAGLQGKFFEMHDLLYENQDTWSKSSSPNTVLETYAQQLGLDVNKFKTDSASSVVADAINADVKAGQALGASATPTFVLNGKKIDQNPRSLDEFKKLLDDALSANKQ